MARSSVVGKGPLSVTLPSGGGSEDTPEQVRDKLASLSESNKIQAASVYYDDSITSLGAGVDEMQEAIEVVDSRLDDLDNDLVGKIYTPNNITLTSTEISNKKVLLSAAPTIPELTTLNTGGVGQTYGIDFTVVNGNELSWDGLGLESILEVGDLIKIVFN